MTFVLLHDKCHGGGGIDELTEIELMTRAAWLYFGAGLNQEATARRLGLTRARVNRLLQQARDQGIVSMAIDAHDLGLQQVEDAIRSAFGLSFCVTTPALGLNAGVQGERPPAEASMRMVGIAGARLLRDRLAVKPAAIIGTGWGRTLAQLGRQMTGTAAPKATFVSLMGSLTANSSFNPFDVVQALAHATGGAGYFLPVPFIADSEADRDLLLAQRAVHRPLALARQADLALISVGELTEASLLRRQGMLTAAEMAELRASGAVGDTNGLFFDAAGKAVDHPLGRRCISVGLEALRRTETVLLSAGPGKIAATAALLRSGAVRGLVIDGDSAVALAETLVGS